MKFVQQISFLLGLTLLSPLVNGAEAEPKRKERPATLETTGERKPGIVYKTVGQKQLQLDLYYPAEKQNLPHPVIVHTHGGGWAAGSRAGVGKGLFAPLIKQLLTEGFAVASVDYRLCRKGANVTMRDCVIDSKDALRYLTKHAASLGLDKERFFVFGDSAGGHISQMLLLSPPESLAGDAELAAVDYRVVAGVSWYGPCDFENLNLFNHDDRPNFNDRFKNRILGEGSVTPEEKRKRYREVSPVNFLKKDSAPLLMIQGDKDTTIPVKHALHMAERAKEIEAPVQTLIVKNSGHNWRKVDAEIEPSREDILKATVTFFVNHAKLPE